MAKTTLLKSPRRGEVYLVDFDPTRGAEIKKTRPALILQNDIANRFSAITIVAAITSHVEPPFYPTEVMIPKGEAGLTTHSVVLLNQIRSIDKLRLVKRLGTVKPGTMARVDKALVISLGLTPM
ncbi:MAG: type II toxin-antitoxin system PemK/MazF family toxin [Patescibacteria group bacterium]